MNPKFIAIAVACLALLGAGWYVADMRGDKKALESQVIQLEADTAQLRAFVARDRQALQEAHKASQKAATQAREAQRKLSDAYQNNPDARDWGDTPIPDVVRDSLAQPAPL